MYIFQDDNVKIHWTQIVKYCFSEHEESFSYTNCPPQRPELNPIESLRDVTLYSLSNTRSCPKINATYDEISVVILHNFVKTMPQQMLNVINAIYSLTNFECATFFGPAV